MDIKQARKNVIEQQIRPWGGLNVKANQALASAWLALTLRPPHGLICCSMTFFLACLISI